MNKSKLACNLDISRTMLYKLEARGMPTDSLDAAIKWRRQNLDVTQIKSWRIDGNPGVHTYDIDETSKKPINDLEKEVSNTQLDLEMKDAETLYRNARALRLKADALLAAAKYSKFTGELIERKIVEKFIFESSRQFRDGLTTLSRRLSPELAGKNEITEIENILSREFRALLENFANTPMAK